MCPGQYRNSFSKSALRGISTISKSGINRFIGERLQYLYEDLNWDLGGGNPPSKGVSSVQYSLH